MDIHIKDFLKHIDDNTNITGVTSKDYLNKWLDGKHAYELLIYEHAPKFDEFPLQEDFSKAYRKWRNEVEAELDWCHSIEDIKWNVINPGYVTNDENALQNRLDFDTIAYCLLKHGELRFTIDELKEIYNNRVKYHPIKSYLDIKSFMEDLAKVDIDIYRLQKGE